MSNAEHITNLEKLRESLVEERRRLAKASVNLGIMNKEPLASRVHAPEIVKLQQMIEVVDRAIDDERGTPKLTQPGSGSSPVLS